LDPEYFGEAEQDEAVDRHRDPDRTQGSGGYGVAKDVCQEKDHRRGHDATQEHHRFAGDLLTGFLLEIVAEWRRGRTNENQDVSGIELLDVRQEHDRRAEKHEQRSQEVSLREILFVPDVEEEKRVEDLGQSDQARVPRTGELEAEEEEAVVQAYEKRDPNHVAESLAVLELAPLLPFGYQRRKKER